MADPSDTTKLDREILTLGLVVVVGSIMAILDATVVNVAVPTLGRDFGASVSTIQWVMTGYLLAFASAIPLTGWLTERFGARRVWMAAIALFTGGSVLSGVAWSAGSLIGFRVLQGLAGGAIMPVGQTILAQAAGPQRMGRVMSVVGVPMLLAPIFGPVVGGVLIDTASWRWIFFLNVPIGAIASALSWRLLPSVPARNGRRLDVVGLALLPPGLAAFVYGLAEVGARGGLRGFGAVAPLVAGLVLVVAFVAWSRRHRARALIDVSLFANRGFAAATATNFLLGVALFGALILLPLYYQAVRGADALETGLLLVPQGLGAALAMPLAGRLTDQLGARRVIPVGVLVGLLGTLAFTQVSAHTSYVLLSAALFVIGLGLGGTIIPSMAVAYQSVGREDVPGATSALNMAQRLAGSIGTALLAVVLQHQIVSNLPSAGSGIRAITTAPPAALADAFGTTFWVALGVLATSLVPALLLPRRRDGYEAAPASNTASPEAA